MSDGATVDEQEASDGGEGPDRPGVVAWTVIVLGWGVVLAALIGVTRAPKLGELSSWATFVVGSAIVHDAVILPVAAGVGWALTRVVPIAWKVPVRSALVVGAVIGLAVWPIARRWGARDDNPSILPVEVWRNLLILWAVLAVGAIIGGIWNTVRSDDTLGGGEER